MYILILLSSLTLHHHPELTTTVSQLLNQTTTIPSFRRLHTSWPWPTVRNLPIQTDYYSCSAPGRSVVVNKNPSWIICCPHISSTTWSRGVVNVDALFVAAPIPTQSRVAPSFVNAFCKTRWREIFLLRRINIQTYQQTIWHPKHLIIVSQWTRKKC